METGEIILIDDDEYTSWLNNYIFSVDNRGYVHVRRKFGYKGRRGGALHRVIMNPPKGKFNHVDHINGNRLDNQKENLRICTHSENMKNRKKQEGVSKYKGVYFFKRTKKWKVQIANDRKWMHLGEYTNEIAAANAYNHYATQFHGEFASLNNAPYMEVDEWMKYRCSKNKTSQYRGVSYDSNSNKWIAQTWDSINRKNVYERLDSEIEAAKKYNELALIYRGLNAKLNEIKELQYIMKE